MNRELNNLKSQLEEQERDADDSLKKYQNHIQNVIFYLNLYNFIKNYYYISYFNKVFAWFPSFHRFKQSNWFNYYWESNLERKNKRNGRES